MFVLGEDVALFGRGEAALRAEAQLVERRIFGGLLDAAQNVVAPLQRSGLRGDEAEHDDLALRQEAQRFEAAGPVAVPFKEIAVDVDAVEHQVGDRLVAARGDEGRTEIAAADVHGDGEIGGTSGERRIDHAGIDAALLGRIVAAIGEHLALRRIAKIGEAAIVELHIAAAGIVEALDRLGVGETEVVIEILHPRIERLVDHLAAAAIVQHRRARDGHFRSFLRMRFQELEMRDHRVMFGAELAGDARRLRLGLDAGELDSLLDLDEFDAVELAQKIHMPPRPPEFAIGDRVEADLFLLGDDLADFVVFDGGEPRPTRHLTDAGRGPP